MINETCSTDENIKQVKVISLKLPIKMIKEIDQARRKVFHSRTGWILECIQEKLDENGLY